MKNTSFCIIFLPLYLAVDLESIVSARSTQTVPFLT